MNLTTTQITRVDAGGDHAIAEVRSSSGPIVATLYCGDAYTIRPTLGWMACDCFDPPYLIRTAGAGRFRKERKHMAEIADAGIDQDFDHSIINPLMAGATICFCHKDQLPKLLPLLNGQYHRFELLEWRKTNPLPVANKNYRPDREFYLHAWSRDHEPVGDLEDKATTVKARSDLTMKKRFGHPTIKPDAVMDKIIRNVAGNTVCDPFMGTGSTGVAAIKAGKTFFGIESNPRWFDAAVTRISEAAEGL